MMRKIVGFFSLSLALFTGSNVWSQNDLQSTDVEEVLEVKEFYQQILEFHPLARQAKLLDEVARQELRMARGYFDPKVQVDYQRKEFKGTNYYNLWNSKFKIPTWIGEIELGYEQNHGDFLNPENTLSDPTGLGGIGVNVPLGRGLIIDARRATLRQAKIFQNIAQAEQVKLLNKLFLSAAKDYWDWYFQHQQYKLLDSAYNFARQRYRGVVASIRLGEKAPIDSVDAKTAFQIRNIDRNQALLNVQNARLKVANYLWGPQDVPLELKENTRPIEFKPLDSGRNFPDLDELLAFAEENHPEILKTRGKLQQLGIEEKLQRYNLLPRADLKYQLLRQVRNVDETTGFDFAQNYKVGLNFEFPIFLRKERAKLQQVRVKQSQSEFDLLQVRREILNQVRAAYNELQFRRQQIIFTGEIMENYRLLRDAEIRKYLNGESSLFLINSRENKFIESQVKFEKERSAFEKAWAMLYWNAGQAFWE